MSHDKYDGRQSSRHYREEYYEDRDGDTHVKSYSSRDLVPSRRQESDLSVEEIRREFPPPGHTHTHSREIRRARSADRGGYDEYDDRRSEYSRYSRDRDASRDRGYDRDYDRGSSKKSSSLYVEEKEKRRLRTISQQEKIIAAIVGGALAVGGKELYDRREAKKDDSEGEIHRNALASAALGAAGALAAYQGVGLYNKRVEKSEEKKGTMIVGRGKDGQLTKYYSDEEEDPKQKKGAKSFLESALAAAGLGTAVKALTGGGDKDKDKDERSDTRSRRGSRSRSRNRSKSPEKKEKNKIQQAAMASLLAGATEAFRVAKEPGGWKGEKAKRIFTAAAGAATIDAAQNPEKNQKLSLAESVIGGLVGNRVIHGSKKNIEEDKLTGRSRSRSRAPSKSDGGGGGSSGVSGLAALATAGLGAFGAKKLMDNHKEKKEEEERSRSRRRSSPGSRDGSPEARHRSRSRSIVDGTRRRLARLGIGNGPDDDRDKKSERGSPPRSSSRARHRRYSDDYDDDRHSKAGGRGGRDDYDDDRDRRRSRSRSRSRRPSHRRRDSESDLGDTDEEERQTKKKRGKQILTIGLAGVATIHAAHNVYQSMEKRNARHQAVREGRLSPEEAKKMKTKALLQDAASVGIAALGIKGAISEVKEAREKSAELKEWKQEKEMRREKRRERLETHQSTVLARERSRDRERSRSVDPSSLNRDTRVVPYGHSHVHGGGPGSVATYDGGGGDGGGDWRRSTRADDRASYNTAAAPRGGGRDRYESDDEGPRYTDGNPYSSAGALPAPPVGYGKR